MIFDKLKFRKIVNLLSIRAKIERIKENYAVFPIAITAPRSYCA